MTLGKACADTPSRPQEERPWTWTPCLPLFSPSKITRKDNSQGNRWQWCLRLSWQRRPAPSVYLYDGLFSSSGERGDLGFALDTKKLKIKTSQSWKNQDTPPRASPFSPIQSKDRTGGCNLLHRSSHAHLHPRRLAQRGRCGPASLTAQSPRKGSPNGDFPLESPSLSRCTCAPRGGTHACVGGTGLSQSSWGWHLSIQLMILFYLSNKHESPHRAYKVSPLHPNRPSLPP